MSNSRIVAVTIEVLDCSHSVICQNDRLGQASKYGQKWFCSIANLVDTDISRFEIEMTADSCYGHNSVKNDQTF